MALPGSPPLGHTGFPSPIQTSSTLLAPGLVLGVAGEPQSMGVKDWPLLWALSPPTTTWEQRGGRPSALSRPHGVHGTVTHRATKSHLWSSVHTRPCWICTAPWSWGAFPWGSRALWCSLRQDSTN